MLTAITTVKPASQQHVGAARLSESEIVISGAALDWLRVVPGLFLADDGH